MKARTPETTRALRDALATLARLLLGARGAVGPVLLAREEPDAYVRDHAAALRRRGVTSIGSVAPEELVGIAVVDALRSVVEIDWRSPPDEAADELRRLRPALPARVWTLARTVEDVPTEAFLHAVARAVTEASPERILATLDRGSDSFVVIPMRAAELADALRLARAARVGTLRDLAHTAPAKRAAPRSTATPARGWKGFLGAMGASSTHGVLLGAARDPEVASELARHVDEAPKGERAVVSAFLSLLAGRTPEGDPLSTLEALRYLSLAPGQEVRCLQHAAELLEAAGPRATRAVVGAIRFSIRPAEGAAAFRTLAPEHRRALRDVVHRALLGKDAASLTAALDAACVVGDGDTRARLAPLVAHALPIVATHAKKALRALASAPEQGARRPRA